MNKCKSFLSLFLVLVMVLSLMPVSAYADAEEENPAAVEETVDNGTAQEQENSALVTDVQDDPLQEKPASLEETVVDESEQTQETEEELPETEPASFMMLTNTAPAIIASGKCGDNITWELYEGDALVIEGSGPMWNTRLGDSYPRTVNTVTIGSGVTSVGTSAFFGFDSLESVSLTDTVTSIGNEAFRNCSLLTGITFPSDLKSIGQFAFSGCVALSGDIVLPEGLISIGSCAFYDCWSLTGIVLPASLTSIEPPLAAGRSSSLTKIDVSESSLTYSSIDGVLYSKDGKTLVCCPGAISGSFTIPESVTDIAVCAFCGCSGLTDITIPKSVKSIEKKAFEDCASLKDVRYGGTESDWAQITIGDDNDPLLDADYHFASGKCGDNLTWVLNENGALIISGNGAMDDFPENRPWSDYAEDITSVVFPEGLTTIGAYAFSDFTTLEEVILPNGLKEIGDYAFSFCENLTDICLPASLESLGENAFFFCSALTAITVPSKITSIPTSAFEYCTSLASAVLPDGIKEICENAFFCCALTGLDLPDGLEVIGENALGGNPFTTIDLPDSTQTIGPWAFQGTGLTSITLPDGIETIEQGTFAACQSLTSITIPGSVALIGENAFNSCSNLAAVTFVGTEDEKNQMTVESGNDPLLNAEWTCTLAGRGTCGTSLSWTLDNNGVLTISGSGAMDDYTSLNPAPWESFNDSITSVIIKDGVTYIGKRAFYGKDEEDQQYANLSSVSIGPDVTAIGDYAFYHCKALTSAAMPDNLTEIGSGAFMGCAFKSVELPDSLETIGSAAFAQCGNLASISIPGSVSSIGAEAFNGCSALTSVILEDGITEIPDYCFIECAALKDISLPASLVSIGEGAFSDCGENIAVIYGGTEAQLAALTGNTADGNELLTNAKWAATIDKGTCGSNISWFLTSDGTLIILGSGAMNDFPEDRPWSDYAEDITSVVLPEGLTTIGAYAFSNCTALEEIILPDGLKRIGDYAFYFCENLTDISLPDSLETLGKYAFFFCSALSSITVPSKITSIPQSAFGLCASLASAVLPEALTEIGEGAFSACALTRLDLPDGLEVIGESALSGNPFTSIDLPDSIQTIGPWAFQGTGLTSITLPGGIETIGEGTFAACQHLTSATLCEGITEIGPSCFNRSGLTEIMLPTTLTEIRGNAFAECSALSSVIYNGTAADKDAIHISEGNDALLLAGWTPCTYTIRFDKNSDTATGSMADQKIAYGKSAALRSNTFKNNGCFFAGWARTADAEQAEFFNIQTVSNLTLAKEITLFAVWKDIKTTGVSIMSAAGNITGTTVNADMYRAKTYQLQAIAEPDSASQLFKWSSSSASIATVDQQGLVTFVKPGTVTITAAATDGSGKSAKATFKVTYYDAVAKFTASTDVPSIGLQVDDSAQMSVFGTDKTSSLDASMFTYTLNSVKNGPFIEVSDTGVITAIRSGGTTTVTAALKNDPLNRKISVSVKTIPVQTETVSVLPDANYELFAGVDANGELCSESGLDAVSYALYLDKIPKGSAARTFPMKLNALDSHGSSASTLNTDYAWASSNTKIATVSKDGTITVKPNIDGACTITATSKDLAKAQGSIAIYVMDKTPRLDAASVTLDTQKTNSVSVALVRSYGAAIEENRVVFEEYDSKTRTYFSSGRITASYDAADELVTFNAEGFQKNQTITGRLAVTMDGGTEPSYYLPLKVVIKNTAPAVTVKQPAKFNLFYTDSTALLNVSVKNEQVTGIELVSDYFAGTDNGDGTVTVSFKNPSAKPVTSAKLLISLEGYSFPVEKTVTIGTVTTKPTLTVTPASGTVNVLLGEKESVFAVYDKNNGEYISVENMSMTAAWADSLVATEDGVVLTLNGEMGGKAAIAVQKENWTSAITVYHTVSVSKVMPTAKLGKATLSLNSNFAGITAETTLTLNQANLAIAGIVKPLLTAAPSGVDKAAAEGWFAISFTYGTLTAKWTEAGKSAIASGTAKNGTYSFSITPVVEGFDGVKAVVLKISVVNTKPTVKLSKTTLNVNSAFGTADSAKVTIQNYLDIMGKFALPMDEDHVKIDERLQISFDEETKTLEVKPLDTAIPNGSYKGTVIFSTGGIDLSPINFTVKVVNTIPTVSASAVTLNKRLSENGTSTLKLSAKGYTVTGISGLNDNVNLKLSFNAEGTLTVQLTEAAKALKAQTFSVTLTPTIKLDASGSETTGKPFVLKVTMIDKAASATVSASGKIDAIARDNGITYTLTKLNNAVGNVTGFELTGDDAGMFQLKQIDPNDKGQPRYMLTLKPEAECATNKAYKVQIEFTLNSGNTVLTPVLNVKPAQSALKLTATPTTRTFYQSQSRSREVIYTVKLTSPAGAEIDSVDIGNVSIWQKALVDVSKNISISINGDTATIKVTLKDTSKLNGGKNYTLPLEFRAAGYAANTSVTKLNLTLKVMK